MSCQTEAGPQPGTVAADESLAPVVFSTDGVERRHHLDLWRATYEPFNSIEVPDGATMAEGFAARNEVWMLGGLALMRNIGPPLAFERTLRHVRRDSTDHWVIRLIGANFRREAGDRP